MSFHAPGAALALVPVLRSISRSTLRQFGPMSPPMRHMLAVAGSGQSAPVPHKDFSHMHEKISGKGESASEAHRDRSPVPGCPRSSSGLSAPSGLLSH